MNLFGENLQETTVNGYVTSSGQKALPLFFPVVRKITMRMFPHKGKVYFRTRDAAALLGIKQPFQFVANCKSSLGPNTILKGPYTKAFRSPDDSDTVTFIEAHDLLEYLESSNTRYMQKYAYGMYGKVIEALRELTKELDT